MLESTEIKCYWIPVFPVYGDELDIDGKVIRSGLVRHSKDSLKMYNYWMTCATEEVALRPKTPYIGAVGQFQGFEVDWAQANRKSFPYLQYQPVTVEGNLAPAPHRQPMVDIPSGMLQMAMHANDNIKATTGLFDSSLGARGNATSGKQELAQQRQGDISNFHFLDSLQITIRQAGRCLNWMIPHYLDTERVVKIMGDDETVSSVTINQQGPIGEILNDMTGGEYTVTVESGPAYQTLRQEAAELFSDMAHNNIELMKVAGDLIIGEMDIPGADKIAARIKKSIPPQLTEGENPEDRNGVDAKLEQIGQIKQQIDMQQQKMQEEGQALAEQEAVAREESMKAREAQLQVDNDKVSLEAERQVFKAEVARIKAELKLAGIEDQSGDGGDEQSLEWKKALLEAETKIAVAEIGANTTKATAAMSANAKGDGTSTVNPDGTTQISDGLSALINTVNTNMAGLVQGQQLLAEHLTRPPRPRTAKKQPDGSFLMTEL
jgi:cytochrome c556